MGKLFLILVLSASTVGLYHAASVSEGFGGTAVQSAERHQLALTRAAAETGWARAKQALMVSFASTTITGTNDGTPYTTTATVTGDRALVVSVGRLPRPRGSGETTYRAVYHLRKNAALSSRPRFMDFAIVADGNLTLSGNSKILFRGVTDGSLNAQTINVHANGTLSGSGNSLAESFGTYSTSVTSGTGSSFAPLYNPDALPSVYQAGRVTVPTVNPDALVAGDGVDYDLPGGTQLMNQVVLGGPRLDPKIYRIRGTAMLSNLTVTGYAVFVVDGDVNVSGTVQGQTLGHTGSQESAIAIYTPGTVNAGGNTTLYAQVLAGAGVKYSGTVNIYGSIAVGGDYTQTGSSRVYYRPASPGLTQGFTGRPDPGFTLLAVREQ